MRGNARLLGLAACLLLGWVSPLVFADGNETLGPPSLPAVAPGTGAVAAGTGLDPSGTGTLSVDVPAGVTVQQVLLYWHGEWATQQDFDEISVNGQWVNGTLIGQSVTCVACASGSDVYGTTFRADITSLGLVTPGSNTLNLTLKGLFDTVNSGATVLAILDDGVSDLASIPIRDGHDWAFRQGPLTEADVTVPQTYTFPASPEDRTAKLILAFGSAQSPFGGCGSATGNIRPNVLEVTVGSGTQVYIDPMTNNDGDFYDTLTLDVLIPAGVTSVTVQAFSEDRNVTSNGCLVASFAWLLTTLVIPPVPPGDEGCTPGYWKNHPDSWPPTGYSPSQTVQSVFSGATAYSGIGTATLLEALSFGGGSGTSGSARILLRAAIAALLNASHPDVAFSLSPAEIISDVNAALASTNRSTMLARASSFDEANNAGCPLN